MKTTETEFECEISFEYEFSKGYPQTWDEPGEPDSVDIHKVFCCGVEMPPKMAENFIAAHAGEAEEECIEDFQAEMEYRAEAAAEAKAEELKYEKGWR